MGRFSKSTISAVLILGLLLPSFIVFTPEAKAQSVSGGYVGSGGSPLVPSLPGLTGYMSGLAPAIAELPLCRAKLANVFRELFPPPDIVSSDELAASKREAILAGERASGIGGNLPEIQFSDRSESASSEAQSVPVIDETQKKLTERQLKEQREQTQIQKELELNDSCFKSIGRLVIKTLLQKMTASTVAWIQSGYQGTPFFVQNPDEFMWNTLSTEFLKFRADIDNEYLFPYGKKWLQSEAVRLNQKFAYNAHYSLDQLIQNTTPQYTAENFLSDFSQGGWGAWIAFTQHPGNNAIGFQIEAGQELQNRVEGAQGWINQQLDRGDGFLGDMRCSDPKGLTWAEEREALLNQDSEFVCNRWEYVTPGSQIAEWATKVTNYPDNNYLQAEDLNDAVAAILDALLARWSEDYMQGGLAYFSSAGSDGGYFINTDNYGYNYSSPQAQRDYVGYQSNHWLQQNPHFNIRTDLNQALIDEQRTYVQKLEEQNVVMEDLLKTVYQLDYCIPGPHPGWKQDSRRILTGVENAIVSKTPADMQDIEEQQIYDMATEIATASAFAIGVGLGAAIGSSIPGLGTAIGAVLGAIIGGILGLFDPEAANEEKLEIYYRLVVGSHTGLHLGTNVRDNLAARIRNKHEVTNGYDTILERYEDMIDKWFNLDRDFMPPVTREAYIEYRKVEGYKQIITGNENRASVLNGVIQRLFNLKEDIGLLNSQFMDPSGTISDEEAYELALRPYLNEFGRLAADMVTGDDIADVDRSLKESASQIKFVYEDLLTGPFGCEQFLRNFPLPADKTALILQTSRAEYPFEIWYDYNEFDSNAALPIPNSGDPLLADLDQYTDKTEGNLMPPYAIGEVYGPGFLSAVWFDFTPEANYNFGGPSCSDGQQPDTQPGEEIDLFDPDPGGVTIYLHSFQLDCLIVSDIWKVAPWPVTVGRRSSGGLELTNPGEDIIWWDATQNNEQAEYSWEQTIYVY